MSDELNMNEMEEAVGGKQHFKPAKDRAGWVQHKVVPGDTLIRLASKYRVPDWKMIREWNPHISSKTNMIVDGGYLCIKDYR